MKPRHFLSSQCDPGKLKGWTSVKNTVLSLPVFPSHYRNRKVEIWGKIHIMRKKLRCATPLNLLLNFYIYAFVTQSMVKIQLLLLMLLLIINFVAAVFFFLGNTLQLMLSLSLKFPFIFVCFYENCSQSYAAYESFIFFMGICTCFMLSVIFKVSKAKNWSCQTNRFLLQPEV